MATVRSSPRVPGPIDLAHPPGIELDRDNDGNYEELIAAAAPANASRGTFSWTVTGLPSGTVRVRVSWTDDLSVSDASDVTFQIRP
jgi:hypothetical protein